VPTWQNPSNNNGASMHAERLTLWQDTVARNREMVMAAKMAEGKR